MKFQLIKTLVATAAVAAFSAASTGAAAAETSLGTTMGGLSNWTQIGTDKTFSFDSLGAGAGSTLTFNFTGEVTTWASSQTFSVLDGGVLHEIFSGSDTTGKTATYTVATLFDGVLFDSHSNSNQQYAPGGTSADFLVYQSNTDSNVYALAYEDYHFGSYNDHNDMVLELTVAAVPEPETYALMLAGLMSVTLLTRRNRSRE